MKTDIKNLKDLSPIEIIVLTNVLEITELIESYKNQALTFISEGKFKEAQDSVQKAGYFRHTPAFLDNMKKQVMEHCSVETLLKIVNQDKFEGNYSWSTPVIIPKDVLPKISSYDEIKANNPKVEVYRKLGAKIIA